MAGQTTEAVEIYQTLLDEIVSCYMTKDFERFQDCIHVPHHFRTATDTFVLRDLKDLKSMFFRYIQHCEDLKMTDYVRRCLSAGFRSTDRIQGTHETHMLNGAKLVSPVFRSTSVIMRMNDRWMVCATESRLKPTSVQGLAMREALAASTAKFDDALTMPPRPLE